MKILSITAGAANMYCGSCLRDNALASALIAQGHDVILAPLYTPTRTDEANVSQRKVLFGGISIYLEQLSPLFRNTPRFLDKLWDAPSVINAFAGRGIAVDPAQLGALTVSMLEGSHGHHRKEVDKLSEWLRNEPRPDVVTLPFTLLIALARPLRETTGRPVICSLQGEELFLDNLLEPYRTQALDLIRNQTDQVDAFIAVSNYCARFMAGYLRIPERKIHVVPLGINTEGYSLARPEKARSFRIGYLARIAPEKGLHLLAEAYHLLRSGPDMGMLSLEVAGYLAPEHRKYLDSVRARMREWGIEDEFHYRGEVDRQQKVRFLQSLDVLSVPCTYDEPKGLFVLEALANAVPVVQPRRGSFPEMLEQTGGGLLVEPDSAPALADGIRRLREDTSLQLELGRAGYENVHRHWTIGTMAERTLAVYSGVVAGAGLPRQ
ncbi:MAG: glycosyltransferase family 4 protein [Acidobacteriia bacterium]|nr:glycosyltransferase family 4 protein [Terriglobia bacterium]